MRGLVGSITGEKPHRTYASLLSDHTVDRNNLNVVQQDKIDYIKRNFTPEEAVACVLQYPPIVFVDVGEQEMKLDAIKPSKPITGTQPIHFEKEAALRPTTIDRKIYNEQTVELLENYVKVCKNYLELPIINDSFADHNQRRDWERGIQQVFTLMGREWNEAFSKFWDYSRYAKNKQTPIINYAEVILDMPNVNLSERLRVRFQEIAAKMRKGREIFLAGDMKGIQMITEQCEKVVNTFTNEKIELDKLTSEMFNSLVESITSRYPIQIPPDRSIKIELLPKEVQAIDFLRKNVDGADLAYFILESPPKVTAKKYGSTETEVIATEPIQTTLSSPDERKVAKKFFAAPPGISKNDLPYAEKAVSFLKNYLTMPRRKDTFQDHDQRQLWQKGMEDVLTMIYKEDSGRKSDNDWNWIFNAIWNSNKYTTNARTYVITGIQELLQMDMPKTVKDPLTAALSRANQGQELFKEGKMDEGTNLISEACQEALQLFSNKER